MTDEQNRPADDEQPEPVVRDKRRLDPETGEVRPEASADVPSEDGGTAAVDGVDDLPTVEAPDVEVSSDAEAPEGRPRLRPR